MSAIVRCRAICCSLSLTHFRREPGQDSPKVLFHGLKNTSRKSNVNPTFAPDESYRAEFFCRISELTQRRQESTGAAVLPSSRVCRPIDTRYGGTTTYRCFESVLLRTESCATARIHHRQFRWSSPMPRRYRRKPQRCLHRAVGCPNIASHLRRNPPPSGSPQPIPQSSCPTP